jgi:Tfp pilus assembly protein PilF
MMARVYVSSTVADLKRERQAVMDWLVAADHQPVHSYRPDSETVRDGCLADVGTCDLYVLILGHRYGFQPAEDNQDGLSITGLEFRRAGECGIPRIALLRTSIPDVSVSDMENPERAALVLAFRAEVTHEVRPAEFSDLEGLLQGLSTGVQAELKKLDQRDEPVGDSARGPGGPDRSGDTLPLRNPNFTGRAGVLEDLESRLAGGPVAVVAVRGLGGVGKSQLALEYAHRMRQAGRYRLAGWVRADSRVTIAEDMAALAPLLWLPEKETVGETVAQVVRALTSLRDWLLVFDNAQNPDDLGGMLPGGGGHVLITSRKRVWGGIATQVDLGEFSRPESVKFVTERTGSDEPEAAAALADELGDLPLALAQAAAYVDTRAITIHRYLESYRDPVLARRLREAGLNSAEYPASVAGTWLLSFRQLSDEHPAAAELLQLCAFLDPDDIDLDLFSAGSAETGDVLARMLGDWQERDETVGALAATSLVTVPAENHLRVHRLVQAVTRDQLDDDQAAEWAKRAVTLVKAIVPPDPSDYRSWPVYAKLAPHIEAVAGHASRQPFQEERIILLRKVGVYLSVSGQLRAARITFERGLAISQAAYGPDHAEVGLALGNLGEVQFQLGERAEARANIERALAILEAAYGVDHLEVGRALGNLSIIQRDLWKLRDARASIERAQAIFLKVYGPGHPQVAKALADLGVVQMRLGELRDARASLARALAINEAADRPDRPEIARALIGLGAVQMRQGELRDARASLERALTISETVYGADHPEVATALINLGAVQMRQGEWGNARANLERALGALQEAYGPDHPEVASALV